MMYYYTIISMTRKNNLFLYYIMAKTRKAGGKWKKGGGTRRMRKAGGKWKKGGGTRKSGGKRRMRTRRHRLSGGINTPPRRETPAEFLKKIPMLPAPAPLETPADFLKANVPMLKVQKLKRGKNMAFKRKNTPKSSPKSSPKFKASDNYTDVYGYVPGVSVPAIPPKKFTQSEMPRDLYQNFSKEEKKKYKQINKDHFRNLGMDVSDSSSHSSSDSSSDTSV